MLAALYLNGTEVDYPGYQRITVSNSGRIEFPAVSGRPSSDFEAANQIMLDDLLLGLHPPIYLAHGVTPVCTSKENL